MARSSQSPLLISFSGIDGAGKSTQINALTGLLSASGYRVHRLAFWDDVCVLRRFREETMLRAAYQLEQVSDWHKQAPKTGSELRAQSSGIKNTV